MQTYLIYFHYKEIFKKLPNAFSKAHNGIL